MPTVTNKVSEPGEVGFFGESQEAEGVRGVGHNGAGVSGTSEKWLGVYGESKEAEGVRGVGHQGAGVSGSSEKWHGVYGESQESEGVRGVGHKGAGLSGNSEKWYGVYGESNEAEGVRGVGHQGAGVSGISEKWHGVYGETPSTMGGAGVCGKGHMAGLFEGDVVITGNLTIQGVSIQTWLQRIVQLEQQVNAVKNGGPVGHPPAGARPITVVSSSKPIGQNTFELVIGGSGFQPSERVSIRMRAIFTDHKNPWMFSAVTNANGLGQISAIFSVIVAPGDKMEIQAVGDQSGEASTGGFSQ